MTPRRGKLGIALVFVGFWSLLTLAFDGFIGAGIVRQLLTLSYTPTPGRITASELKSESDSDGTTYRAKISFTYTVAGREYQGDRWRFGEWSSGSCSAAQAMVNRFPAGSAATVYYDPANPARAILVAGLQPLDAFVALFFTPFNCVMIGGWVTLAGLALGVGPMAPRPRGVEVWESGGITTARMVGAAPPVFAGLAATGLIAFVAIFILGLSTRLQPPIPVTAAVWGGAVALGIVTYLRARHRIARGDCDLKIDPVRRTLVLPAKAGSDDLPFSAVRAVDLAPGSMSSDDKPASWKVRLTCDGREKPATLVDLPGRDRAECLASWLRETIGLAPEPPAAS